ncbi:hypothetical protein D1007_32052 [Hordeum vulgare]|nr:hypothetical protein D1007_32052 [Hordeum vulgare]
MCQRQLRGNREADLTGEVLDLGRPLDVVGGRDHGNIKVLQMVVSVIDLPLDVVGGRDHANIKVLQMVVSVIDLDKAGDGGVLDVDLKEIETAAAFTEVVLRLRTPDSGRDEWLYCHSGVLAAGSGYLACARTAPRRHPHLACTRAATACTDYLESAPWDEADEEILAVAPRLGAHRVLARLRPADPGPATAIFLARLGAHRARLRPRAPRRPPCAPPPSRPSAPTAPASSLKSAAQEQREYMLTEDDDASLLTFDAGGSNASSLTPLKRFRLRVAPPTEVIQLDDNDQRQPAAGVAPIVSEVPVAEMPVVSAPPVSSVVVTTTPTGL